MNFLASDCNMIFVGRPLLLAHHHSVSKLMQGHVLVCMNISGLMYGSTIYYSI